MQATVTKHITLTSDITNYDKKHAYQTLRKKHLQNTLQKTCLPELCGCLTIDI